MRLTRRSVNLGLAATFWRRPRFSPRARAEGDTIKIGMVLPVTGPAADTGKYALTGAKIALDRVNKAGGVLGKQVELVIEDDQTTNPGAVLAFSKLAAQPDIVAFLGSIRSTQDHAMAPDILKIGKPVCFGGTDPEADQDGQSLAVPLPPQRHLFRPRDRRLRRRDARQEELGDRPFDRRLRHRRRQGAVGRARQDSAPRSPSIRAIPTRARISRRSCWRSNHRAPTSSAPISPSTTTSAIFARQLRQLGVTIPWVGSPSIVDRRRGQARRPRAVRHLRRRRLRRGFQPRGEGIRQALSRASQACRRTTRVPGPTTRSACSARRSTRPASTDPDKIREAILATTRLQGRRGRIQFRPVRRRPARLQHRAEREGHDRLRQAHRIHRLTAIARRRRASAARPRIRGSNCEIV